MPVVDSVPLITQAPENVTCVTPAADGAVTVRLFIVMDGLFGDVTRDVVNAAVPAVVEVMDTLYKVSAGPAALAALIAGPAPEITSVDVPALNVIPVVVAQEIAVAPLKVTVLLPKLIVRVLLLLDDSCVAVTL